MKVLPSPASPRVLADAPMRKQGSCGSHEAVSLVATSVSRDACGVDVVVMVALNALLSLSRGCADPVAPGPSGALL
jgi:hypothetical protein